MPRRRDAVADFLAHQERVEELHARGSALRLEAARFLGELVLEAGLAAWTVRDLKAGLARLSEEGPRRRLEPAGVHADRSATAVVSGGQEKSPAHAQGE